MRLLRYHRLYAVWCFNFNLGGEGVSLVMTKAEVEEPRGIKPVVCAPESARGQRGASPLQAYALRPVTECNCVAKRRGGGQQEVNDQSVR